MLDAAFRKIIDPPLNRLGRRMADRGISANAVTLAGLGIGILAVPAIWAGAFGLALVIVLVSRLSDGLDGAIARASQKTAFGGYLDIVADFAFYGIIPLAFVLHDPDANGLAGAFVLASFYVNGSSFLGYAILAEKKGIETSAQGQKTLYYSNGLLEGAETIGFFVAICLFPDAFPALAWVFGGLCFVTATLRVYGASRVFTA
ncbi:CDP-alcohol phosphatidyltransferase family protein [Pelagovum pacificum]|uniref:CDP-alcohol phosphatidyltransferase family protein n=1 Tax=Pelagovum pacificum TaxID=2588711 RepID=A0A5C5GGZ3_9RHOB|nr:CDP-alcohol phosphatidyltransferase family protein [Pelagovum pacificum]QQA42826.1 CDP-alcohol phosphatidyltransferase family protein [Pelagovum pacificum]TNY34025.1 CDP-alcohol phosphatidyltransferase family protein [Pelagovum pacificum]